MPYGTISVLETLAGANMTVQNYGEEAAWSAVRVALDAHNAELQDAISDLATVTDMRLAPYGATGAMVMQFTDEFGAVDVQKVPVGQNVGLPLREAQIAIGWTRRAFERMSTAQLAAEFSAANDADVRLIMSEIHRAIFTPTNNLTYVDRLVDNLTLPLHALLNGDGQVPPAGAGSAAFDGQHSHYLASETLTEEALVGAIDTVREHGVGGELCIYINRAQEATIRAFPLFERYIDSRIVAGNGESYATGALDPVNVNNRAIGLFEGAVVFVKPWIQPNYIAVIDNDPTVKALGIRTPNGTLTTGEGALRIAADHEHYPLRAQHMERLFGVGVVNRHKAAALYIGGSTYTAPAM